MSKILFRHDTLFTLARHYDVHADHNVEKILHQLLISSAKNTAAAYGLDDTRALDQLCGCVKTIFEDRRSMLVYFFGELTTSQLGFL